MTNRPSGAREWLKSQGWTDGETDNHRDAAWWRDKMEAYAPSRARWARGFN